MKPLVAIIGKPNTGKSTFFNKLSGKRVSIVFDEPGVTRDRVYFDTEWAGYAFTLIDTGGIAAKSADEMWLHIKRQAEIALSSADVVIFFTDAKSGVTADDYDIAALLRRAGKPAVLAVNKTDGADYNNAEAEFYALKCGKPFLISAEHKIGFGDLLDRVVSFFKSKAEETAEDAGVKVAFIGKPNAGKSSLVNRLLGYERTIVSPSAGTTRDATDTPVTADGKDYILIDTAGMRRKRGVEPDSAEGYGVLRSMLAVRRADVAAVVFDGAEEISEQDVRIAGYAHEEGKPSVIIVNKSDLLDGGAARADIEEKLKRALAFMDYRKTVFVSAKTGRGADKIFPAVDYVWGKANFRATTGLLNDALAQAVTAMEPPAKAGRRLKLYYITQTGVCPPTFVLFVNDGKLMHFSYKRYIENVIRKTFNLDGTPVRLIIRNKGEED